LMTIHHAVCDGWSLGILQRELAALYEAFLKGGPSPLPRSKNDYAAFAESQRKWLAGPGCEKPLAWWKQKLEGARVTLDLPVARTRPAVQTYHGAMENFTLPPALSSRLHELSRRENATLFMVLLSAFQTLLFRYTRQEDILVASPIAGRTRQE